MKILTSLAATALFANITCLAGAATPLVNLVGENAPLVVSFTDVPSLVKNMQESPWAKTWNDEQVRKFFAPMRAQMDFDSLDEKLKAETGRSFSELVAFASGDAIFALTTLDFDFEAEDAENNLPFIAAIELGSNASDVQRLLEEDRKKNPENRYESEDFDGVTLHIEILQSEQNANSPDRAYWAIVDGTWIFGFHKETVLTAIDAFKKGGVENPFGKSTSYLANKEKCGPSHVAMTVNFSVIMPRLQQLIEAKAAERGGQANPFLNPAAILPALGLDAWNQMYLNIHVTDAQTVMTGGFTFSEERGLLKMFSYGPGPVARPAFVPEKWVTVSTTKFSLKSFYNGLEEMIAAYNPAVFGMGQMYLQQFNQQLGIDIKRDFFGSFGADTLTAYALRPGTSETAPAALDELDQVIAFSLDNPSAFNTALQALLKAAGPRAEQMIIKRDYLGATISTLPIPAAGGQQNSLSYSVAKNYLFISMGSASAIESVLQGNQGSFWDRSDVKQAFAKIPGDASSFSYQDTRTLIGSGFQSLVKMAESQAGLPNANPESAMVDPSAKPDAQTIAKYWGDSVGYITRDSQGYFVKSTLDHKK